MKITSIQPAGAFWRPGDKFPEDLPHLAFAGRSNVGKSSLLNRLIGRRRLAPVSSSPGKTRKIHFFKINQAFYLADLPGYGYTKLPVKVRMLWRENIERYLEGNKLLRGVVHLIDIRHALSDLDSQMLAYLAQRGIPTVIALTKADKLSRSRRCRMTESLLDSLGGAVTRDQVVVTSARTGEGCPELLKAVEDLIARVSGSSGPANGGK
ncbi:MAG TPA: ribosome biogenesis GTP-binding protein YihA/YsxC [archaeon]|nr:ribosome biogenesis GTP-binding protein YihA/YsxC [archaeon]